jgi:hypothetical protein
MIQLTPQMRILAAVEPVDFRKGIDGLCGLCRRTLQHDPFGGAVFVFCNKKRNAVRILAYDGQGYWLCTKRLSQGRLRWWPAGGAVSSLAVHEMQLLLWNGNPNDAGVAPMWRKIAPSV